MGGGGGREGGRSTFNKGDIKCGGFCKYTLSAVCSDGSNPSPGGYDAGEGEEGGDDYTKKGDSRECGVP